MYERSLRLMSFTRATNHFFPSYTFQEGLKMPETFRTRTSLLNSSRTLVNSLTHTPHSHVCTHSLSPPPAHAQTHTHTPRTHNYSQRPSPRAEKDDAETPSWRQSEGGGGDSEARRESVCTSGADRLLLSMALAASASFLAKGSWEMRDA